LDRLLGAAADVELGRVQTPQQAAHLLADLDARIALGGSRLGRR